MSFASGPGANFSGSLSGPFVIAQAETAARINYLPGNYRAYLWHNGRSQDYDGTESRHTGIGFSVDQKVDDDLTLFGRYGRQLKGRVRFDNALTLGAELAGGSWARSADSLGIAFGSLRTSADFRRDSLTAVGYQADGAERQTEIYYRYRVNGHLDLSPHVQWIRNPGGNGDAATVKVAGLRAKVAF